MRALISLIVLIFSFSAYADKDPQRFHIIIDAGHGGSDHGATRGKYRESDIALAVSKELFNIFEKYPEYKVTLTRTKDETLTPPVRTKIARSLKADLFLSIHLNSSLSSYVHGAEFYFKNQLPPEEESLFLANSENQTDTETLIEETVPKSASVLGAILDDLKNSYDLVMSRTLAESLKGKWRSDHGVTNSHIRQGPFQVLQNVQMPSLLVELGFISNPQEAAWLSQAPTHKKLALSIFNGVQELKEKMDKYRETSHISTHAN